MTELSSKIMQLMGYMSDIPDIVYNKIERNLFLKMAIFEDMQLKGLDTSLWLNRPTDEEIANFPIPREKIREIVIRSQILTLNNSKSVPARG